MQGALTDEPDSFSEQIALQFPDELLPHSVPIFRLLKSKIADTRELYVLADTSYGRQVPFQNSRDEKADIRGE